MMGILKKPDNATLLWRALRKKFPNDWACASFVGQNPEVARSKGFGGVTPLMLAAQKRLPHLVEWLLRAGAPVAETDGRGRTALHYALLTEYPCHDVIKTLCRRDADLYAPDAKNVCPMGYALKSCSKGVIKVMRDMAAEAREERAFEAEIRAFEAEEAARQAQESAPLDMAGLRNALKTAVNNAANGVKPAAQPVAQPGAFASEHTLDTSMGKVTIITAAHGIRAAGPKP